MVRADYPCVSGWVSPSGTVSGCVPKSGVVSGSVPSGSGGLENPISINSISDFIAKLLNIVVTIGTPIVVFFLILSGFRFVLARGNEETLKSAKTGLLYTLIGAALLLGAWTVAQVITNTVAALQ